ncbi:MAG: HAMP domain-containing sensor histidine kinase [Bacteroidota bacterium]
MHSLLKRQIRKYLPPGLKKCPGIDVFFDSIDKSYLDYDKKLQMMQHATALSSNELYETNSRLNKESENQRKILQTLSQTVSSIENGANGTLETIVDYDPQKLVDDIENQAGKIVQITAEKNSLLNNLEQQNESLNNYAHMVSHDLKSPIRNIHSLLTWVLEDNGDYIRKECGDRFELIFQNLSKMDSLIDGILKHATIDSMQEAITMVNLNHLVAEIQRTIFIPKNINITIEGELPILYAGKYRLEQLFKNLLTNAITATEHKTSGEIGLAAQQEAPDTWLFTITDNGKGIPKHLQNGIFGMFKKLENDANATGIGLALVKKIINHFNGDVWLSSEEGVGTTFFFTIKTRIDD